MLQRFCAAYDARHFGRAAEAAHVTQPAISKSIAKLEADLGVPLFERTASGVEPTRFAHLLRRHAQVVLDELRFVGMEIAAVVGGDAGEFRIGVGPAFGLSVFTPHLADLRRSFPNLSVHVRIGVRDEILPLVVEGGIDLWFGSLYELDRVAELTVVSTGRAEMAAFCARGHPLAGSASVRLKDLVPYPWANFIDDAHGPLMLDGVFARAGLDPPRVVLRSSSVALMLAAAATTDLLVYAADALAPEAALRGLVRLPLREPTWSFPTGLAFRHSAAHLAVVRRLRERMAFRVADAR